MPSAPVFNLDALLAPIAGENPSGENLQYSGLHDEIREARRADDDVPQGDWVRELKVADWEKVAELAGESLSGKTKDLQIVAWLSEAAVNMNGFPGLRDSLKLANGLLETVLGHAVSRDRRGERSRSAGQRARVAGPPGRGGRPEDPADEARRRELQLLPVGRRPAVRLSGRHLEALQRGAQQLEEKRARAQSDGKITGEEIRKAKSETRRAFYEELYADVAESWAALKALDKEMDARFSRQTPGLGSLTKTLDGIRTLLEKVVKEKRIEEPDPSDAVEGAEGETAGGAAGGPAGPSGHGTRRSPSSRRSPTTSGGPSRTARSRTSSSAPSRGGRCRSTPGSST